MKAKWLLLFLLLVSVVGTIQAGIKKQTVDYGDALVPLQGILYYDEDSPAKRPGVMIVHQWMGITDYEKKRAEQLADLGYVVFLADIYGQGVRPATVKEASELSGKYRADRPLLRQRALMGLQQLKVFKLTDSARIAALGYCFGGGAVLEMARTGVSLNAVVSFHGNLDTPRPEDSRFSTEILVLHGADDPYVPWEQVTAFRKEMQDTKAKWQLAMFGQAVHAFSQPDVGTDPSKGAAYNEVADIDSWGIMYRFLTRVFYKRQPK